MRRTRWSCVLPYAAALFCATLLAAALAGCGGSGPPGGISKSEAVRITKDYLDQVDRMHTTTAPPGATTPPGEPDWWAPIKVDVTSATLGKPNPIYGPSDFDGLVWTIKVKTNKMDWAPVVVIDAMTGEIVGGIIW